MYPIRDHFYHLILVTFAVERYFGTREHKNFAPGFLHEGLSTMGCPCDFREKLRATWLPLHWLSWQEPSYDLIAINMRLRLYSNIKK